MSSLARSLVAEIAADPEAVEELRRLLSPLVPSAVPADDGWLDTRSAAAYLSISVNALHKRTSAREIPVHQNVPGGKCWFKRSELDEWRRSA